MEILFLPPGHALGDGILVGAGEGGEDQRTGVGTALVDVHPGAFLVGLADGGHIGEVQLRVNAVGVHIHGQGDNVYVSSALAVAEEGAFHPVGSGQQRQLRIGNAGAPVIVRMQGDGDILPVLEIFAHVLNLAGVDVRQAHFHGDGQVDDDIVVRARLQHVQNRVAHFQGVFRLGAGEAFGGILEAEIALIFRGQLLHKPGAFHGNLLDFLLALAEDLLPLGNGSGIIEVNDGVGGTLAGLEGPADDVLPALGQHLDGHITGNHVIFNQGAQELVLGFRGGGEAYLDFLEADAKEHMVEFQLLFQTHGNHQALVAVPQVYAAPLGSLFDVILVNPLEVVARSRVIADCVFAGIHMRFSPFISGRKKTAAASTGIDGKAACSRRSGGLPHQSEDWFAMTSFF